MMSDHHPCIIFPSPVSISYTRRSTDYCYYPNGPPPPPPPPPTGPVDACVKITTGTGEFDEGHLDVYIDTGSGYVEVTSSSDVFVAGQVVIDKCYQGLVGVQVSNTLSNAWGGSIVSSRSNKLSPYTAMYCENCSGGAATTGYIVVDGNEDGIGDAECLNSEVCTLLNLAEEVVPTLMVSYRLCFKFTYFDPFPHTKSLILSFLTLCTTTYIYIAK